jgi:hypothetical protein
MSVFPKSALAWARPRLRPCIHSLPPSLQVAEKVKPNLPMLNDQRRDLRREGRSPDPAVRRRVNAGLRKVTKVEMQMEREASKEVLFGAQVREAMRQGQLHFVRFRRPCRSNLPSIDASRPSRSNPNLIHC